MQTLEKLVDRIGSFLKGGKAIDDPLKKWIESKRPWAPSPITPVAIDPFSEVSGEYAAIQRCIALALVLEVPVGDLAIDGSMLVGEGVAAALLDNANDEVIHYKAFQEAAKAYGVSEAMVAGAQKFQDKLMKLAADHPPVLLAGYMELTVFFVTLAMLRKYGSPELKAMVQYVSRDEATHVRVNYHLIDTLELGDPPAMANLLRQQIIEWLVEPLTMVDEQVYWLDQSLSLRDSRKAPDLQWTKTGQFRAFFEMPGY